MQLAAALCYKIDKAWSFQGHVVETRRVLLFENDPIQIQGGRLRLGVHKNIESLGDPRDETKDTISPHELYTREVMEHPERFSASTIRVWTNTEHLMFSSVLFALQ